MKIIKNAELLEVECSNCKAILLPTLKDLRKCPRYGYSREKDRIKCPICKNIIIAKFKEHEKDWK